MKISKSRLSQIIKEEISQQVASQVMRLLKNRISELEQEVENLSSTSTDSIIAVVDSLAVLAQVLGVEQFAHVLIDTSKTLEKL